MYACMYVCIYIYIYICIYMIIGFAIDVKRCLDIRFLIFLKLILAKLSLIHQWQPDKMVKSHSRVVAVNHGTSHSQPHTAYWPFVNH